MPLLIARGNNGLMFTDRNQAAHLLAKRLMVWRGQNPLVLAIPRGAVPMAKVMAELLEGEFDVVLVRKLRAPHQPELAIGAVDESGWTLIAPHAASMEISAAYIEAEKRMQMKTIEKRRAQYTPVRPSINPAGRIVIVVDDGLATGSTMMAALHGLRLRQPKRLICAVPVAPADTLDKIRPLADELLCLQTPEFFEAVGLHYQHFPQVEDDEVIELLRKE